MKKINILDKKVANRIAAGEVVEKPASVIKELIENSLDAKATSIKIEIEEGGIKSIVITDNGCGISSEDVETAFMPHATSKISDLYDLDNIKTLGFRGEALSSIAAVSQIELTSKTEEEDLGTLLTLEGGDVVSSTKISCNVGTKIIVKNLFFNTPARKKFLRKPKTEEAEITHLVQKLMMANSDVKFKYIVDGKIIYNTMGSGLFDVIYTIYGRETAENLIEINFKKDKYSINGYIGTPEISKANRTYQTLMINNRIVQNFLVSNSVANAFEHFLMKNKFPFFVLNLTMPFDSVDVNVHPSKQEVKFENNNMIYNMFYTATLDALYSADHVKNISISNENEVQNVEEELKTALPIYNNIKVIEEANSNYVESDSQPQIQEVDVNFGISFKEAQAQDKLFKFEGGLPILNAVDNEMVFNKMEYKEEPFVLFSEKPKIIGNIFNTYIITQQKDDIYLIDQHACHEKKLFDNLVKSVDENQVAKQNLLVPYIIKCNPIEKVFFEENIESLNKLGFTIETLNNDLIISEIPFLLANIKIEDFIQELKENLKMVNKKSSDLIRDFLAQTACKHAVKGGDVLTIEEIESLINNLNSDMVLLCPHGRPIVVKITKKEIEKWFKRIV